MKFKQRVRRLPWHQEIPCWIGAILLLPIMLPLMVAAMLFGMAMIIFDKVNDGFGH